MDYNKKLASTGQTNGIEDSRKKVEEAENQKLDTYILINGQTHVLAIDFVQLTHKKLIKS